MAIEVGFRSPLRIYLVLQIDRRVRSQIDRLVPVDEYQY